MSEDKKTDEQTSRIVNKDDKDNNDNNIIINKLYSESNSSVKHNSKIDYSNTAKLTSDEESEKYIKEMHELSDKNEFKNNVIVFGLGIIVLSIIVFSVLMNVSFKKPNADVATNEVVKKPITSNSSPTLEAPKNSIYDYLDVEKNREASLKKAVDLNKGSKTGVTVYLLSEILRSNTYDITTETSTVKELMTNLTSLGWKKNSDFNELEKGDICFTTDMPEKTGVPSHAYIFMGWVEDGKTDYANIVDGQVEEFGNVLHKRNISIETPKKDKFSFFLKK